MQRIRMSLPYFHTFNWEVEVVTVDAQYIDINKDDLLLQSLPPDIKIHKIKALPKKWTAKFGLGSIALRALWFYKQKVNELLKAGRFDLIYFSTTQFPVCILGAYWQKKFKIPYVIDMQDPWHSEYYHNKPKNQRPPKYWLAYRLNKYLEPIAMKKVNGLIGVSAAYIENLKTRYPAIKHIPAATITFGAYEPDLGIVQANARQFKPLLDTSTVNIVYIGRGGTDMHQAIFPLFSAFKQYAQTNADQAARLKFYFIGTSYAAAGTGRPTILPFAKQMGVASNVIEITDRISYYHTLATLQQADGLFIPGSDDPQYTASKLYPYLLMQKPLLAILNKNSPAMRTLREYGVDTAYDYRSVKPAAIISFVSNIIQQNLPVPVYNNDAVQKYSAKEMTRLQCQLFDTVIF
jgi:hypothetical protein